MLPVSEERAEAVSGELATTDLLSCVANAFMEFRGIPELSLNEIEKKVKEQCLRLFGMMKLE